MSKKIRTLSALLTSILLTAGLAGCGSKSTSGNGEKITLKLWHIYTAQDANTEGFKAAIKDWNDANPNVQIEAEATENEAYKTKIKTAVSANEAPDIFFSWGAGFAQPFVEAGKVLALDDYLKDGTKDKLTGGALTYVTYDEKIYGLTFFSGAGTFFVNKEMFEQHDVKIPETFDELLDAVKAFRAKGIVPMAVGEKDKWPGMFYYDILAMRAGGSKLSNDALAGKASFEDPAFVTAAEKLLQLIDAGAFDEAALGLTRDESEIPFIQGQIPMYYNGSWVAGSIEKDDSPTKGKIEARNFPVLTDGKGDKDEILGGSVDCFMVKANTKYKDEAVRAVKFITEAFAKHGYELGAGIPAWKVSVDESKISPLTKQVSAIVQKSTGSTIWWDTYLSGADADTHKDLVAKLFGKTITPEEFAKQMQAINEK
ncbi:extracellular solute-binding protein [Clostridium thermarum]|uniref:extracellular solute-binding protein n=1 Tax=Clostridium thermarum TaxID=1716543 RepID=UPI00111C9C9F|nr:extracellular solute-binding protein [Clostridium thermarum]